MTDFQRLAQTIIPHPCSMESLGRNMQHLQSYMGDKYRNAQWCLVTINESAEEYPFRSADKSANCNVDAHFNGGKPTTLPDGSKSETGVLTAVDVDDRFKYSRDGAKGFVVLDDTLDPPQWRAVYFEQEAFMFTAESDGDGELDNITPVSPPPYTQDPSLTFVDLTNEFNLPLDHYPPRQRLLVHRIPQPDGLDRLWIMPWVYVSTTVVTDVQIRYGKLCVKKKTIGVLSAGADADAAETCQKLDFGNLMEGVEKKNAIDRIYIDEKDPSNIYANCISVYTDGETTKKKKQIALTTCT